MLFTVSGGQWPCDGDTLWFSRPKIPTEKSPSRGDGAPRHPRDRAGNSGMQDPPECCPCQT